MDGALRTLLSSGTDALNATGNTAQFGAPLPLLCTPATQSTSVRRWVAAVHSHSGLC